MNCGLQQHAGKAAASATEARSPVEPRVWSVECRQALRGCLHAGASAHPLPRRQDGVRAVVAGVPRLQRAGKLEADDGPELCQLGAKEGLRAGGGAGQGRIVMPGEKQAAPAARKRRGPPAPQRTQQAAELFG
jgi:hypothetical protein